MFMDEFIMLLAGVIAGSVGALAGGGLVSFLRCRASRLRNEKRERIIVAVEEKWLEADSVITSYRTGQIPADAFRHALSEKVGDINRIYKPCLHLLDIFFVKYTERLIEDYNRMIEATVVFKEETALKEPLTEPPVTEEPAVEFGPDKQMAESASSVPAPEEEIVSAMAEVSKEEDELPLETFLEMKTLTGTAEEGIRTSLVPEDRKETVKSTAHEEKKKEEDAFRTPADAFVEETIAAEPASSFIFVDKVVSGTTLLPAPASKEDAGAEEKPLEDEETMAEAAVSFPSRMPVVPPVEPLPPQPAKPRPFVLPQPPVPSFAREEVAQPATIYDIEAETIIADRNDLLNAPKVAEQQPDKSNLGITGDDVSDMLDKFFGGK